MVLVEDSLDLETSEGAAIIGLELVDTTPPFDAVLIARRGGALATAAAARARAPALQPYCHSAAESRVMQLD